MRFIGKTVAALVTRGIQPPAQVDLLKKIALERRSAVIVVTDDERMIVGFDTIYGLKDGRIVPAVSTAEAQARVESVVAATS